MGITSEAVHRSSMGRSEMMRARDADAARIRAEVAAARGDHPSNSDWKPRSPWEHHTGMVDDPGPDVEMIG